MSIEITYRLDRDPDVGQLSYSINYFIQPYIDPESGEYFGDTQWVVTYSRASEPNPLPLTGSSGESGDIYLDLYLDESSTIQNYRLNVKVWNTFQGEINAEILEWNVLSAAGANGPLTFNGTNGIDFFIGGHGVDIVNGFDGNDRIDAGDGNDQLYGDAGADLIDGGKGDDLMVGGADDDYYIVDSLNDVVQESANGGADTIASSVSWTLGAEVEGLILTGGPSGSSNIDGTGNAASNAITGNGGANTLSGLGADDRLDGAAGNDKLLGGDGNDTLNGGFGNDTMEGGGDNDLYYVDSKLDVVKEAVGGGIDTVHLLMAGTYTLSKEVEHLTYFGQEAFRGIGNASNNTITGGRGPNVLEGRAGDDTLNGDIGNDRLVGGLGADVLNGGNGIDTAVYSASSAAVTIDLATGTVSGGEATGDQLTSIENLVGSAFNDRLTGNAVANSLSGGAGNDTLTGGEGNDVLAGGAGADRLLGGNGIDTINYTGSSAAVVVNLATQTASGGDAQGDRLQSIENVYGGNGDDTLTGNGSANIFRGYAGVDTIDGGLGNDKIYGGAGGDFLNGGDGVDTLSYGGSLTGGVVIDLGRNLAQFGDAQGDTILAFESVEGSELGDSLTGSMAANRLIGRAGADTLDGGRGSDILTGGIGADRFVFGTNYGFDRVTDFKIADGDVIELNLGSAFDTFEEVMAVASYSGTNDVVFKFSATDTLMLQGAQLWALNESNFDLS